MAKEEGYIAHLQKVVKENPDDGKKRAALVQAALNEGLIEFTREYIAEANKELTKGYRLPEFYHKPLIKALGDVGEAKLVEMLVRDLEENYDYKEDETIKRMVRKGRRYINRDYPIFPPTIHEEEWWEGPHLLNEEGLVEWFPGRIKSVHMETVSFILIGHDEDNYLDVQLMEMEKGEIGALSTNFPKRPLRRPWLEFGIYADESVSITFHKREIE